jgi:hypothetical protein
LYRYVKGRLESAESHEVSMESALEVGLRTVY